MRSPVDSMESSTSLVDRLTDSLKDKILNGELSADEAVNISAIAKENGVSLIPVREALARLSAWGLLQFLPNRGYRVVPRLDPEARAALFQAREILELSAVPLAVIHRTDEQLKTLREINKQMRSLDKSKLADQRSFFRLNDQFHRHYLQMSGNPFLERMFESLSFDLLLSRETTTPVQIPRLCLEHDQIIDAAKKRDATLLNDILRRHIRSTR